MIVHYLDTSVESNIRTETIFLHHTTGALKIRYKIELILNMSTRQE